MESIRRVAAVRRDIERLRALGYPMLANPGTAGYRLSAGAAVPPLLLDDDEAVAIAMCPRTAASGSITGIEETSVRALAKLEQLLPSRLRHRINTLQTVTVPMAHTGPAADPNTLTTIAVACRDSLRLRFDYRTHDGTSAIRTTEPHRLVHAGRRCSAYRYQARFTLHVDDRTAADRISPTTGTLEPIDEHSCTLRTGSHSLDEPAIYVTTMGFDFEVHEPAELVEHVRTLAARLTAATDQMPRQHSPRHHGAE